jgi:GDPmannose 4,6-dehydratase
MTINYRESYGIFGTSGLLFNHESPLRGRAFVTRKITDAVARYHVTGEGGLELGNLDAERDWGFAGDYVEGMHAMLQTDTPETYVLATGRTETVRHFVDMAFRAVDIRVDWTGQGQDEVGRNAANGDVLVRVNPAFYRPAEVDRLVGDYSAAKRDLGWAPKMSLETLCKIMVDADLERARARKPD